VSRAFGARSTALAYELAKALRQLAIPRSIRRWNRTTLRKKPVQIGAKVVSRAKYLVFQLADLGAPPSVRDNSGSDGPAAAGMCLGVRFATLDKTVQTLCHVRPRCAARADFGNERSRSVICAGLRLLGGGTGGPLFGEHCCYRSFAWVGSPAGVAAEASGAFIWERSG
jgi:hypothetical protein